MFLFINGGLFLLVGIAFTLGYMYKSSNIEAILQISDLHIESFGYISDSFLKNV